MKILLVDAYDSFVYTIFYYLESLGANVMVCRHDKISLTDIEENRPDFIVLGPGPGRPECTNYSMILGGFAGIIPILGVCLGHQAIGQFYGLTIDNAKKLVHGKTSKITHDGKGCFQGVNGSLVATRYHSLAVYQVADKYRCPVVVTARSLEDDEIMGLRVESQLVESVQFHPESVSTIDGLRVFQNFVRFYS